MDNTLQFTMAMIDRLGAQDTQTAAEMALQLHRHEQLLVRLDRLAQAVGVVVAARVESAGAADSAREEREAAESAARIAEMVARTERDREDNRRHEEDHVLRMAEIRARQARDAARDAAREQMAEPVLNRL